MSVEAVLRAALLADATLPNLLPGGIAQVQIPQNPTYPVMAFQRISTQFLYTHSMETTQASVGWARFQFTVFAQSPTGAADSLAIGLALKQALSKFSCVASAPYKQAPNFVLGERMDWEPQSSPQPLAKLIIDAKIWFSE